MSGSVYLFFGPPGSGKGTQAQILADRIKGKIIAPGNELRAMEKENKLPDIIKNKMNAGGLVDLTFVKTIVEKMVGATDSLTDIIMEGHPRTLQQARELEEILSTYGRSVAYFIYLETDEKQMVHRVSGRRICGNCGHVAASSDVNCLTCGGELIKRADDSLEALSNRIYSFTEHAKPLLDFYKKKGKLLVVDGNATVDEAARVIADKIKI